MRLYLEMLVAEVCRCELRSLLPLPIFLPQKNRLSILGSDPGSKASYFVGCSYLIRKSRFSTLAAALGSAMWMVAFDGILLNSIIS